MALVVKNLPANADAGSIPGSARSPGGGLGNPLQYSCLENAMDRRAWRAAVHRVAKSQTRLKQLSMQARTHAEEESYRLKAGREKSPGVELWEAMHSPYRVSSVAPQSSLSKLPDSTNATTLTVYRENVFY